MSSTRGDGDARTATGGAARADKIIHTTIYEWPSRDDWARTRRTVYADDVDKVTDQVSDNPPDYATHDEITRADAELRDYWRDLGRQLRQANAAATAVWPLHNHRARRASTGLALVRGRDLLHPEARELVERAEKIRHHRQLINACVEQLAGANGRAHLHLWTVDNADRRTPAGRLPTWRAIVSRWKAARDLAADQYAEQVRDLPIDDAAWERELQRRADIEQSRSVRHATSARPSRRTAAGDEQARRLDEQAARLLAKLRQVRP